MSERRRRRRKSPVQDAVDHITEARDKACLEGKFINRFKGRGVFTQEYIAPESFVVEYRGVLSQSKNLDDKNNYLFDFIWNGQHHCIDALKEDGTLGRLVNDDHINPNCKVKKIVVKGRPHLCLFALKEIFPGQEITYNYGDYPWPWRSMAHGNKTCTEEKKKVLTSTEQQKELFGGTNRPMTEVTAAPGSSQDDHAHCKEPCNTESDKEMPTSAPQQKELFGGKNRPMTEVTAAPGSSQDDHCHHEVKCADVNSLEQCEECRGRPMSGLRWLGLTCQLCLKSWHKSCFFKKNSSLAFLAIQDVAPGDGSDCSDGSDEDYIPCSSCSSDGYNPEELRCTSSDLPASRKDHEDPSSRNTDPSLPFCKARKADLMSSKQKKKRVPQLIDCMEQQDKDASTSGKCSIEEDLVADSESSDDDPTTSNTKSLLTTAAESFSHVSVTTKYAPSPKGSSAENYCYVCKTPQSRITRHLKKHEKEKPEIAEAFLLPKNSKERRKLLEKLRNKGNYEHNQEVLTNNDGLLKVRRRTKKSNSSLKTNTYAHCAYCKGMFIRKELWRHSRRCPSKTVSESEAIGKAKCLFLADFAESTCSQPISPGVWKVLKNMREDEVASVVRNDFLILQLCQSLYNKHGSDPTKFEYMRQKVREMGRLLLTLRKNKNVFSFEDATKPKNFYKVVEAVRTLAGYDEETNCYRTPSLALKLGHSLKKIGDIILCRAIAAEDEAMIKAAERFTQLCTKEWTGLVSHTALASLTKSKFNKPSTLPFTEDVQLLHQYLEKKSAEAVENLKEHESSQTYAELARVILAQIIIFNRRRAGEVSKMTLESFEKRDQTELHEDLAAGLSQFEQNLAKHFSRIEIMGKRGRKVAVLLNPEVLSAATLLVEKRDVCNVHEENPFLFGRPECPSTSHYRGQDCIRKFAFMCGAKNPQYLRSTHLRKHVATLSQILNLKDNELDQLANFLGHDIRVHRDFYRLPEATIEMAKISKLLLAMEKGSLAKFQGKSLDEIEVEDELDPDLDEGELDDQSEEDNEGGGAEHDNVGGVDSDNGGFDDDDDHDEHDDDSGADGDDEEVGVNSDGGGVDNESSRARGRREKRKRMESTKHETKTPKVPQREVSGIQGEVTSSKDEAPVFRRSLKT